MLFGRVLLVNEMAQGIKQCTGLGDIALIFRKGSILQANISKTTACCRQIIIRFSENHERCSSIVVEIKKIFFIWESCLAVVIGTTPIKMATTPAFLLTWWLGRILLLVPDLELQMLPQSHNHRHLNDCYVCNCTKYMGIVWPFQLDSLIFKDFVKVNNFTF